MAAALGCHTAARAAGERAGEVVFWLGGQTTGVCCHTAGHVSCIPRVCQKHVHAPSQAVRNILQQCYANPAAVTDELVDVILKPGLQPGAADVFLDFISYSGGPTPEALMRDVQVPVSVVWGAEDPWEKVEWGRAFKVSYASCLGVLEVMMVTQFCAGVCFGGGVCGACRSGSLPPGRGS